jgi:hypothetical protein
MRKTRTYKQDTRTGQYRREEVVIKFSKHGVDQEWRVRFNNGRLLTNEVYTNWGKPTYLRTKEHCNSLEDVLAYLGFYAYSRSSIKIVGVYDCENKGLKAILDFDINLNKLKGSVYFGRYEIIFNHNETDCFVTYIGHLSPTVNDGTYLVRGKRDLLVRTNNIIGRLNSSMEFLQALKKIEQVEKIEA